MTNTRPARVRKVLVSVAFLLLFATLGLAWAEELRSDARLRGSGEAGYVAGEVIVKFRPAVGDQDVGALLNRHGLATARLRRAGSYRIVRVPNAQVVENVVAALRREPAVEYAEPNGIVQALMVPNDPYYSYQWHFHGSSGHINAEPAWDIETGSASVVVAVVDTGVAYEDFGRKFKRAPDLAQTAFVPGYDFVNNDSHPNDDDGHGTHVTGTIAQSTNNALGVAGIAFKCAVMPVKVLNQNGSGTVDWVAQGIYYAADHGAKVINLSLGVGTDYDTLKNAVQHAYDKGVTVCAAAGNDGTSVANYPAGYDDFVIAVGATRYDEALAYYSNYGPSVDLVAPGGDLGVDQNSDGYGDGVLQQTFSGQPSNFGYYFFHGTSMACPHVAGIVALLISNGVTGPDSVREALQSTAKDLGAPGRDNTYGWGLVNAYAALTYAPTPVHDVAVKSVTAPSSVLRGEAVPITVEVANAGNQVETFDVTVMESPDGGLVGTQTVTGLAPGASATLNGFTWDTAGASLGDHTITATASAVAGETNLANNSAATTVRVLDALAAVHVASIDMSGQRKGVTAQAKAVVTVVNNSGSPVGGATVYGAWSGAYVGSQSAVTDGAGRVTFTSGKVKGSGTFTFTVTDIVKDGCAYDPGSNVETSDSITL